VGRPPRCVDSVSLAPAPLAHRADTHEAHRLPCAKSKLTVNTGRQLGFLILRGVDSIGRAGPRPRGTFEKVPTQVSPSVSLFQLCFQLRRDLSSLGIQICRSSFRHLSSDITRCMLGKSGASPGHVDVVGCFSQSSSSPTARQKRDTQWQHYSRKCSIIVASSFEKRSLYHTPLRNIILYFYDIIIFTVSNRQWCIKYPKVILE